MRIKILILLLLGFITAWSKPSKKIDTLIFVVNAPGSAPYLYYDLLSQSYQGLVVDFFSQIEDLDFPETIFIDSNRGRSEKFIIKGKADMMLTSRAWADDPDKLIFSDKISLHQSYLYSLSPFKDDFTLQSMQTKTICTRRGYIYPGLQPYFEDNLLVRVDSSSQETMARMLQKDRCDYAVMNDHNATAIFAHQDFCESTIYQSPIPTNSVDLSYAMGKKISSLKASINKQIKIYAESGKLNKSLIKHSSNLTFPISRKCNNTEHKPTN